MSGLRVQEIHPSFANNLPSINASIYIAHQRNTIFVTLLKRNIYKCKHVVTFFITENSLNTVLKRLYTLKCFNPVLLLHNSCLLSARYWKTELNLVHWISTESDCQSEKVFRHFPMVWCLIYENCCFFFSLATTSGKKG